MTASIPGSFAANGCSDTRRIGGYGALARRVERPLITTRPSRCSPPVDPRAVASADVVEDCADAIFDFTPEALAECAASGALAIVSAAFGPSPSREVG